MFNEEIRTLSDEILFKLLHNTKPNLNDVFSECFLGTLFYNKIVKCDKITYSPNFVFPNKRMKKKKQ